MVNLFRELKRRKVVQVAAAYAITAWLIIQVIVSIEAPLGLPDWVDTLVIVMLAVGFPIALILSWAYDFTSEGIQPARETETAPQRINASALPFSLALQIVILLAVGFLLFDQYYSGSPRPSGDIGINQEIRSRVVSRFPLDVELETGVIGNDLLAISPLGDRFVYRGSAGLVIRELQTLEPRLLLEDGESQSRSSPAFAPGGEELVYWERNSGELKRLAVTGGAPVTVAREVTYPFGVSWSPDDSIFFGQPDGVYRVQNGRAESKTLLVPNPVGMQVYGPQLLPDGETLLYSVSELGTWDSGQVIALNLSSGDQSVLLQGGNRARYISAGYLVYAIAHDLFGVRFDPATLAVSGEPRLLVEQVERGLSRWQTGAAHFDVSDNGTLVYLKQNLQSDRAVVWIDRNGREEAVGILPRQYTHPRISPDGSKLVLNESEPDNRVWVWDFARETQTRLALGDFGGDWPQWTSDGSRIAYHPSTGEKIDWQTFNNVGNPQTLASGENLNFGAWHPEDFSPSGDSLVFHGRATPSSGWDLGVVHLGDASRVSWLTDEPLNQWRADISPDGRWLAYSSDETGRSEVQVRPFPNFDDGRWIVSTRGGTYPRWSADGSELFFLEPGDPPRMVSVQVTSEESEFNFGELKPLMEWPYFNSFDVSRDGERFLALKPLANGNDTTGDQIVVVQNWFDEILSDEQSRTR